MQQELTVKKIEDRLRGKIAELSRQPEFQWQDGRANYALEPDGSPAVRAAAAVCSMEFDLWKNSRNPAMVGFYPVGFREIWEFYANNRKKKTNETGRSTIFQLAETFESAIKRFSRAVVISAMLPVSSSVFETYNTLIREKSFAPWDGYSKAWGELGQLLNRGINRLGFDLLREDRVVVVMNNANLKRLSTETVPTTHQGASHGVCKGGNYSQKSIAAITGLAQFGVSRMVFRDEIIDGEPRRLLGVLASIILFDQEKPSANDGMLALNDRWYETLSNLSDFTRNDEGSNSRRFCGYLTMDGKGGCRRCISFCPSGALANSSPRPDGTYDETVSRQQHRFWEGALQFDNGRCCDERGQLSNLYEEWMCGRCVSICGGEGRINPDAIETFDRLKSELTGG